MNVILIRHFKVEHQWKKFCSCNEFFDDLSAYNSKPITETKEIDYPIRTVYISNLSRTAATATYLKGEKHIINTALINEVDFRGVAKSTFRLPNFFWYLIMTAKWRMNSGSVTEKLKDTRLRARDFLAMIEAKNEDCIVVSHGLFLLVLMHLMTKRGYKGGVKKKRLENGEIIEMKK
jgi:broad specificity phosphatase PhoE